MPVRNLLHGPALWRFVSLVLVIGLLGACGPSVSTSRAPAGEPTSSGGQASVTGAETTVSPSSATIDAFRIAWPDSGAPTPFRISTAGPGGAALLTYIYDTLTWKDEAGIIPWLARSWEVSPDGRDYTFTLEPGVRWHDGQPLTAEDVKFSFDYYARNPYLWMSTEPVESAEVQPPNRVRIRLTQPYAPFLEDIAGGVPIIPRHVWENIADPRTYQGTDASIGSGPFSVAEYRSAEAAYRLTANPAYFKGPVKAREFQQINVPPEGRLQALQQGQLDLFMSQDASVAELVKNDPKIKVFESAPFSIVRLVVNTQRPPLNRVEVRQALIFALDRSRIAELMTKSAPIVGSPGVIPPESPWFNPSVAGKYPYDPARARALLGGADLTIELIADPSVREPDVMEPMLAEAGVKLMVRRLDAKSRNDLLREGNFQLALTSHIGVGGDPDFLRRWYAGEESNDFAQGSIFRNAEFDRLGREEAATIDPARRHDLIFSMQETLAEYLPTIPLYHRRFYWAYDSTKATPMNTWGGLINGVPFVHNKLMLLNR